MTLENFWTRVPWVCCGTWLLFLTVACKILQHTYFRDQEDEK